MFAPTPSTPASGRSASSRYNNSTATGSPFSPLIPHPDYTESAPSSSFVDNTDPRRVVAGLETTTRTTPQRIASLNNNNNNNDIDNTSTPSTAHLYPYHDQRCTPQLQHSPCPPDGTLSLFPGNPTPSASYRSAQHSQLQLAQHQQLYSHSPSRTTSDASPSLEPSAPFTPRLYHLSTDPATPRTPSPMPLYPSSTPQSYGGGISGATFISGMDPIQSSPAHLASSQPSFAVLDHGLGLKPSSTTTTGAAASFAGRPPLRPTVSHNNAVFPSSITGPGATPVTTSSAGEAPASGAHHPSWPRRAGPGPAAPTTSAERTTREYPSSSFTVACDPDVSRSTKASGPTTVPTVPTPALILNPSSTLGPAQMPVHTHAHHSPSPAPAPSVKVEDNNPSGPHTHTQTHTHASSPAHQRSYAHAAAASAAAAGAHHSADTTPYQHGQPPSSSSAFIASSAAPNVNGTNVGGAPATSVSAQTTTTTAAGATGVPVAAAPGVAPVPAHVGPNGYHTQPHSVNALPPIQHQPSPPPSTTYPAASDNVSATSDSGAYHYNHYTPLGAPGATIAAAPGHAPAPSSHGQHQQVVHAASGPPHAHQNPQPHQHQHHPQQHPAPNGWTTYHHTYSQPLLPPLSQTTYPVSWPPHQAPPPPHMNSHYQPYQPYGAHGRQEEPILMPGEMPAPRPPISYAALIGEALLTSPPPHQLYVSEISESIKNRYAYYRQNPSKVYNGVRHQTSMCKAFVKIPRPFGDQSGGARKWGIRAGCETWFSPGLYCPPPNASPSPSSSSSRNRSHGSGGGGGGGGGGGSSNGLGKARSTAQSKRLAIGTSGSPRPSRSSRRGGRGGDDDDIPEPFSPTTNTGGPSVGPAFDSTTSRVSVWTPVMSGGGGFQPLPPTSQQQQQQQQPLVVASPPLTSISAADQIYWQKHGSNATPQVHPQSWGYGSAGYAHTSASAPTWYSSGVSGPGGPGSSSSVGMQMSTAPSGYSHHTHAQAAAAAASAPSGHAAHGSSGSAGGYPTPITQPAGSPDWRSDSVPRGSAAAVAGGAQDQHHYGSYAQPGHSIGHTHGHGHGHGHSYHHSDGGRVHYTYDHGHGSHQHSRSMDGSHDGYDDGQYSAHHGGYSPASNSGADGGNGPMSPLDRSPERQ